MWDVSTIYMRWYIENHFKVQIFILKKHRLQSRVKHDKYHITVENFWSTAATLQGNKSTRELYIYIKVNII